MTPLKAPVWTWEVPAYFFAGGLAGIAAAIACVATLAGGDVATIRAARLLAIAGAAVSPALLVSDLGRPRRFLHMLRVFKPQSAMSMGVWTLVLFSGATAGALALWLTDPAVPMRSAMLVVADLVAAATGLVLATYTGVLLGATTLPVWATRHRLLPLEFGVSSLGAAASAIELAAGSTTPLHRIALVAAAIETGLWLADRRRGRHRAGGITSGPLLAGPLALGLRIAGGFWPVARPVAAAAALFGSLLLRFGWIEAGRTEAASMRQ